MNFTTERDIPGNVKKNKNFYQTTSSSIGSRGGKNRPGFFSNAKVTNIQVNSYFDVPIDHGNIDVATETNVLNYIRSLIGLPQIAVDPEKEIKKIPKTSSESSSN